MGNKKYVPAGYLFDFAKVISGLFGGKHRTDKEHEVIINDFIDKHAITLDAGGWCWDMEKCPQGDCVLVLERTKFFDNNITFAKKYEKELIDLVSDCNDVIEGALAWRLLPVIPTKEGDA